MITRFSAFALGLLVWVGSPLSHARETDNDWIAAWVAAPQVPDYSSPDNPTRQHFSRETTLRQIVHLGLGGKRVRIRFSNLFGTKPLEIRRAHVALRVKESEIDPATDRALTFGKTGGASIVIPPGKTAVSNPVDMTTRAGADLAISIFLPSETDGTTMHRWGLKTYVFSAGNTSVVKTLKPWFFLSGVDVDPAHGAKAIVALGDSLTDFYSELEPEKKEARWVDVLQKRLRAAGKNVVVLNEGISGSRLLHDRSEGAAPTRDRGLKRFERDILALPKVSTVIVLLGTNDIGQPGSAASVSQAVTAKQLIQGFETLLKKAHSKGIHVIGGTVPPLEGSTFGFYSPEKEKIRQEFNAWVRTGGKFDGVCDFDSALRDPAHPTKLLEAFDSGDHTHPNDRGEEAMGNACSLN